MVRWKNKRVVVFEWKEYIGFYPSKTGVVLEETSGEVLVKIGFSKKWKFKDWANETKIAEKEVGFAKLIL